jgi:ribonuclease BN (tRNA processing enzyme)
VDSIKITIVGNGGCLNNGLPYNAFLLNDTMLIETPPDIMVSLKTLQLDVDNIDTVFISHLHGDHTFGLPFLFINKWLSSRQKGTDSQFTILGPNGIDQFAQTLTEYAFTRSHPCYEWLQHNIRFTIIKNHAEIPVNTLTVSCFELPHLVETYGFFIKHHHELLFAYIADTTWCPQVEQLLVQKPKLVLMDMNGGNPNVHTSLDEVIKKGLPLTKGETIYYGTHLAEEFDHPDEHIQCAKQGEEIMIQYE